MSNFESYLSYIDKNLQTQLLITVTVLFVSRLVLGYLRTPKNLPPGPWGIPFFGYLLFFGKNPPMTIANLRKRYGDIIRINMGSEYAICLTSYKAIKEALVKQADIFAERPPHHIPVELKDTPGLLRSSGDLWLQLRRFTLTNTRDFGLGRLQFEPRIMDEIHHFVTEIDAFKGQPIPNIREVTHKSVTNLVSMIIFGERFDYNDKQFIEFLSSSKEHFRRIGIDRLVGLFSPLVAKVLRLKSPVPPAVGMIKVLSDMVVKHEAKHAANNQESRDNFIDAWFTQSLRKKNPTTKYLTNSHLTIVLFDLFIAGSETSTNTLEWGLLHMMNHPNIQDKVHEEIDRVIGKERIPSMSDQELMPYTEATLMEISRLTSVLPVALIHRNNADTELLGKFIPKGSTVITNLWSVHHDPEIFPDPEEFKPERFLTEDGKIIRAEEYIPFSLGKRRCMGESLAKMELFLFFTSMLQHFTFKKVNETIDFDFDYGLVTMPKTQPMFAIPR